MAKPCEGKTLSLVAEQLHCRAGERSLLHDVSLRLTPGEVHAVLGPNGAGKSTLLKALGGELRPQAGRIELNGQALDAMPPRERARHRAVLPQLDRLRFGFRAEQVVSMGRQPCLRHGPAREREIVLSALDAAGVRALAQRRYTMLSGGERARVQFARVLAQIWEPLPSGPRYLLLDEPTASLDLAHQHRLMMTARRFAADGVGVLAVLHDPNLALRYADRVSLLRDGRVLAGGTPTAVMDAAHLHRLYGIEVDIIQVPGQRGWIVPRTPGDTASD